MLRGGWKRHMSAIASVLAIATVSPAVVAAPKRPKRTAPAPTPKKAPPPAPANDPPAPKTALVFESTPEGASVTIDGTAAGKTPITVPVSPGKHDVHVVLDGYEPVDRAVIATFDKATPVTIALAAKPAAAPTPAPAAETTPPEPAQESAATPPPPAPAEGDKQAAPKLATGPAPMIYGYATGGAAVVALGVGALFGVRALAASSDFDSNPTDETGRDGEEYAAISTAGFVAGAVLAAATALIFLLPRDDAKKSASRFSPVIRF